jgi:hypothetical protein
MDRRIIGLCLMGLAAILGSTYYLCDAIYHGGSAGKGLSNDYWGFWKLGGLPLLIPAHAALWTGLVYFIIGEVVHLVRIFRRRPGPPPFPLDEDRTAEQDERGGPGRGITTRGPKAP